MGASPVNTPATRAVLEAATELRAAARLRLAELGRELDDAGDSDTRSEIRAEQATIAATMRALAKLTRGYQ